MQRIQELYKRAWGAWSAPVLVFNTSIVLLGLTALAALYFLWKWKTITDKAFLSFLALCRIGCAGVRILPMDFQLPHAVAAILAFVFRALAAIASHKFQRAPSSFFSIILGSLSLTAFVLFMLRMELWSRSRWNRMHDVTLNATLGDDVRWILNERVMRCR